MDKLEPLKATLERFVLDPANHDFLALIKAIRNGIVYGCKVRFPHALVMTLLFKSGTASSKAVAILTATRKHATNLALYAFLYKTITILRRRYAPKALPRSNPFVAGLAAGYLVFGRHPAGRNAVTQQMVIYVDARAVLGFAKLAVSPPTAPRARNRLGFQAGYEAVKSNPRESTVTASGFLLNPLLSLFGQPNMPDTQREMLRKQILKNSWPVFAAVSWGCVMWLFERYPEVLQPSLRSSMTFLYEDCEEWDGLGNLLWRNK